MSFLYFSISSTEMFCEVLFTNVAVKLMLTILFPLSSIDRVITISSPFGSTNFTGLFAQYTYELILGYFAAIGSTLSHTLKSEE